MNENSFSFHRKTRIEQLINVLDKQHLENCKYQLNKIVNIKKAKLKEKYSLTSHQIIQQQLSPPKRIYPPFSIIPPSCTGQEFISEKIKNNILNPDRCYSSEHNVKVGYCLLPKKRSLIQNRIVTNNQFEQYSRIYDEQSGQFKHKKIMALLGSRDLAGKKQKYMRMKRTLFQKFLPDKYNFYNQISKVNEKSIQFSNLKKSSLKYIDKQQENDLSEVRSHFKPGSTKDINTLNVGQIYKDKMELKRSMSGRKPRFTKNLQSLQ